MSKKSFQLKNFEKKFLIHRERKKSFKILKKFLNEYNEIITLVLIIKIITLKNNYINIKKIFKLWSGGIEDLFLEQSNI